MAQPRKARAGVAFLYGIAGFSLIGILAIALRLKPGTPAGDAYEVKRAEERRAHLAEIHKAAEEKLLAPPSWANKEKGIVRIPISDAIAITAKTLASKEVKATDIKAETIPSLIVPPYLNKAGEGEKPAEAGAPEAPAATEAPSSEAPATEGPAGETPTTEEPATESPATGATGAEAAGTENTPAAGEQNATSGEEAAPEATPEAPNSAN